MTPTFEKVKQIIIDKLCCFDEAVTPQAKLYDDLGMDSLDALDLCYEIEEVYGCSIPDPDFAEMKTVDDIVTYIDTKVLAPAQ